MLIDADLRGKIWTDGSQQAHEVIERIYKGEREVYVLSDLGLFQEWLGICRNRS